MSRTILSATGIVVAAMLAVTAWAWGQIPAGAQVPIHWGIDGQPDGFAPKEVGLLIGPAVAAGLGVLLAVIPHVEPRREHLRRSGGAYRTVAIAVLVFLAAVHVASTVAAVGEAVDLATLVTLGAGILFAVIGNLMGKIRSNFLFGIRTPWTLTSERAWARTHRVGGRAMVGLGLVIVAVTLLGVRGAALVVVVVGGTLLLTLGAVVYSYLVWRSDPERRTFGA